MKDSLTVITMAVLTLTSAAKPHNQPGDCQADPPRSAPGLWTYYWYSPETATHQQPSCFTQNGKRVYFTATTRNSHKQPGPDAKLVSQLLPLRLPDDFYYWYSADQAADQSPTDQNCVYIEGKLRRYTAATLSNHPDGKAKDYIFVGKGNRYTEMTGAACGEDQKANER